MLPKNYKILSALCLLSMTTLAADEISQDQLTIQAEPIPAASPQIQSTVQTEQPSPEVLQAPIQSQPVPAQDLTVSPIQTQQPSPEVLQAPVQSQPIPAQDLTVSPVQSQPMPTQDLAVSPIQTQEPSPDVKSASSPQAEPHQQVINFSSLPKALSKA